MERNQELVLVINNASYDQFNGFKVRFVGFTKIPYRFGSLGWARGKYLLNRLQGELSEFKLTISREESSKIDLGEKPVEVILNYEDLTELLQSYWQQSEYCGKRAINQSLSDIFPEVFIDERKIVAELPKEIKSLAPTREQLEAATRFLRSTRKYALKGKDTLQFLTSGHVLHNVHLESILNEFEGRLSQKLPESDWQTFFKNNMLVLNPGYIKVIPKTNISVVTAELPDFLLISVDGYVDVYEIKLPDTEMLNYDISRSNYYWSSDIAKAISQTENYITSLDNNRYAIEQKIEDKYGLKLTILRPRGYIIAGISAQLHEKGKGDDFRLLNESLRNTRIIPYDTLLNNFKNLSKTLLEIG